LLPRLKEKRLDWFKIATIFGTFLIVYFTWRQAKMTTFMRNETMPKIANIEHRGGNTFKVFITNNKPHNITLEDAFVKEKKFWFIYSKPLKIKWTPQGKSEDVNFYSSRAEVIIRAKRSTPQYVIKDQYEFYLSIPGYHEQSTYKVFARTTGGLCQSICPPSRKLQSEASELEAGERK